MLDPEALPPDRHKLEHNSVHSPRCKEGGSRVKHIQLGTLHIEMPEGDAVVRRQQLCESGRPEVMGWMPGVEGVTHTSWGEGLPNLTAIRSAPSVCPAFLEWRSPFSCSAMDAPSLPSGNTCSEAV